MLLSRHILSKRRAMLGHDLEPVNRSDMFLEKNIKDIDVPLVS